MDSVDGTVPRSDILELVDQNAVHDRDVTEISLEFIDDRLTNSKKTQAA